jgi:hypothetical protein
MKTWTRNDYTTFLKKLRDYIGKDQSMKDCGAIKKIIDSLEKNYICKDEFRWLL